MEKLFEEAFKYWKNENTAGRKDFKKSVEVLQNEAMETGKAGLGFPVSLNEPCCPGLLDLVEWYNSREGKRGGKDDEVAEKFFKATFTLLSDCNNEAYAETLPKQGKAELKILEYIPDQETARKFDFTDKECKALHRAYKKGGDCFSADYSEYDDDDEEYDESLNIGGDWNFDSDGDDDEDYELTADWFSISIAYGHVYVGVDDLIEVPFWRFSDTFQNKMAELVEKQFKEEQK